MRRRIAEALKHRVQKGARDERGAVAIIFALSIVVLVPMVLGLFDLYTAHEQRERLQDAVDAAALYAARSELSNDNDINALAQKALTANLKLIRGATLVSSNFKLADNATKVIGTATIQPLAIAPALWTHNNVTVGTEVVRNSRNLEVSLVLDTTGSMSGTKITDLKAAANELVDLVVKPQQVPFYSKVALVPWAAGVNVNARAVDARGAVTGTRAVTNVASWMSGSQLDVSDATKANPVVITTNNDHGFAANQVVMLTGIKGMTQINGVPYKVALVSGQSKKFSLKTLAGANVNGTSYGSYQTSSGDKVTKCIRTDCTMTVTAANHGYQNGDYIFIDGVSPSGLDDVLDNSAYAISGVTTNTFNIFVPSGPTTAWTSGGASYCTRYGCEYIRFTNSNNSAVKMYRVSTCVSERTGSQQFTDAAPSNTLLGYHYPAVGGVAGTTVSYTSPCPAVPIMPLTTDKDAVKAQIAAMTAVGTTAGQVGVAWGWYMLSPNFNYLWSGNASAEYTKPDTLKVAVIMTDGALNTAYCNGVSSSDSLMFPDDRINCSAPNGSTFTQSLALCGAMRDAGIIIYTVGFQISGDQTATNFVNGCANDPDRVYLPESGSQLKDAFKSIGAELNNLRLAK